MKGSIGTFALRLAAMVLLFAPAADAQAQGIGQTICHDVWDANLFKSFRVCNEVYYPPPTPPTVAAAPEPPVRRTTGSESFVPIDPIAEARKAQLRATEHRARRVQLCANHPTG